MKAKDYFDKFIGPIKECENDNQKLMAVTNAIYVNFQYELNQIVEQRKIKFLNAAISVIDEQNRKWNALERLIEKAGIPPVLKINGFRNAKAMQVPEIRKIYESRGIEFPFEDQK